MVKKFKKLTEIELLMNIFLYYINSCEQLHRHPGIMAGRVNNLPDPRDNDIERFEDLKLLIRQGNEEALKAVVIGKGVIPAAPNDDHHQMPYGEGYYSESLAHFAAECGNIIILSVLRNINPVSFDKLYKEDVKDVINNPKTPENIKKNLKNWYNDKYPPRNN